MKYSDSCCECSRSRGKCCMDLIAGILIALIAFTLGMILGLALGSAIASALVPLIFLGAILLLLLILRILVLWCCDRDSD